MKGIILAGGQGTRLFPITQSVSKQLLPIYDKPLIYYPLSTLMQIGVRDILCITNSSDHENYKKILKDGSQWGINIQFDIQKEPNGIAESFIIGEKFINNEPVALILGDNFFYGIQFEDIDYKKISNHKGAIIFSYEVPDPEKYGVIVFDSKNKIIKIDEKPSKPKSNIISTGFYIYDSKVSEIAKKIRPSKRNELEITDINNYYIKKNQLSNIDLKNGSVWLDTGNAESLFQASQYVKIIQERSQILIGSPEIIALQKNWINKKIIKKNIKIYKKNEYYKKLFDIISKK